MPRRQPTLNRLRINYSRTEPLSTPRVSCQATQFILHHDESRRGKRSFPRFPRLHIVHRVPGRMQMRIRQVQLIFKAAGSWPANYSRNQTREYRISNFFGESFPPRELPRRIDARLQINFPGIRSVIEDLSLISTFLAAGPRSAMPLKVSSSRKYQYLDPTAPLAAAKIQLHRIKSSNSNLKAIQPFTGFNSSVHFI